jgi:hypothetical protein
MLKISLNSPRHKRGHLVETGERDPSLLVHAKPLATIPDHDFAVSQAKFFDGELGKLSLASPPRLPLVPSRQCPV